MAGAFFTNNKCEEVKMKKLTGCFIALMVLLMCVSLNAQSNRIGVIGGINLANLSTDEPGVEPSTLTAYGFGGVLDLRIGNSMWLCFEPMYLQKGAEQEVTEDGMTMDMNVKANYIEDPVFLKIALGSGDTRPYVMAGPTVGFLMSANAAVSAMGISVDVDIKDMMESLDYGIGFGGGISFAMGRNRLFVEGRYTMGLADVQKEGEVNIAGETEVMEDADVKTKGIQIMAGITIPIGGQ